MSLCEDCCNALFDDPRNAQTCTTCCNFLRDTGNYAGERELVDQIRERMRIVLGAAQTVQELLLFVRRVRRNRRCEFKQAVLGGRRPGYDLF